MTAVDTPSLRIQYRALPVFQRWVWAVLAAAVVPKSSLEVQA